MTNALLLELASVAWRDAVEASHEARFEDAAHLMNTALDIEQAATPGRTRKDQKCSP